MLRKIFPEILINLYPNHALASKNNYHIKKLAEDSFSSSFMTLRTAYEMIKLCEFIIPNAGKY
jgi:hypothetical protein